MRLRRWVVVRSDTTPVYGTVPGTECVVAGPFFTFRWGAYPAVRRLVLFDGVWLPCGVPLHHFDERKLPRRG